MPRVIVHRATYDPAVVREKIFAILDGLGARQRIGSSTRVLIKPNLLAPAKPERAMLTHPAVIRATAEYALERGATVQISDSPALGSLQKVVQESGIQQALQGLDVHFMPFNASLAVPVGEPFNRLEIAADAVNAEVLINLPKLKTHSQMLLTLGVKNLFGCIVGFRKPEWHLRAGVDRKRFAQLLVEIYRCLQPPLNILDGILAMEGDGPGLSGTPRELGVLIGSDDALALDTAVCKMLGLNPERLLTLLVAREMDLGGAATEMQGEIPEVRDFKLPEITPLVFGPRPLHGVLRRHLVQRPVCEAPRCKICGECVKYCPVKAISRQRQGVAFDYDQCIRCYCCVEVCPHGALRAEEPRLGRWLRKVMQYRLATV